MTVIQKNQKFEAKQVKRPSQKLKKLKVPMKTNKKKPKPKLRKRLVVKNVKRNTPEFQLPEITGVKGIEPWEMEVDPWKQLVSLCQN